MAYTPENNPYIPGDPYSYDLKWVVTNIKELIANYTGQMDELKAYIRDYIDHLDISPVVYAQLQIMYNNGQFDAIIASFITDNKVLLVDTDQSGIFTQTEKEQGRKNLTAGGSNINLLDNPWFTVNQREQTSYTTPYDYTADRWINRGGNINITADGIEWEPTAIGQYFMQKMEPYILKGIEGKTVTASIMYADGTIEAHTFTAPSDGNSYANNFAFNPTLGLVLQNNSNNNYGFWLRAGALTPITIKAIKLEIGATSTLINDAPPNYAEELTKCKHYFQRIKASSGGGTFWGVCENTTRAVFPNITNSPEMRSIPAATFTGTINVRKVGSPSTDNPITGVGVKFNPSVISLEATTTGLTAGDPVMLMLTAGASISLSSDL